MVRELLMMVLAFTPILLTLIALILVIPAMLFNSTGIAVMSLILFLIAFILMIAFNRIHEVDEKNSA